MAKETFIVGKSNVNRIPSQLRRQIPQILGYFCLNVLLEVGVSLEIEQGSVREEVAVKAVTPDFVVDIIEPADLELRRFYSKNKFYHLSLLDIARDLVVVDIGAYIADSSLFFASRSNVTKVFAFEPYYPSYQRAMNNIRHNAVLAPKIILSPQGISTNQDCAFTVYEGASYFNGLDMQQDGRYLSQWDGLISLPSPAYVNARFIDIHAVLDLVLKDNPSSRLCIKLNNLRNQEKIIEELLSDPRIKFVYAIMGEFQSKRIENLFRDSELKFYYNNFSYKIYGNQLGYFYAVRSFI